ncbi:MAG: cache domain-containing protein, partial [Bacteroidetes bacterium]|nr:cache domain-containing protein [Bacteroidota bacterium]
MKKIIIKSIQTQLILYFTIAILTPTIITGILGIQLINNQIINRAETKTLSDLNSAREIYRNKLSNIESITRLTAARNIVISSVLKHDADVLQKVLNKTLSDENLDIFTIVDVNGNVICRGSNPDKNGDNLSRNEFVKQVLKTKKKVSGTSIVSAEELSKESNKLVEQVRMVITPTLKAKPREDTIETSGMMLESAVPIFDDKQNIIGVLIGGVLINRNYEIVDKVKQVVYEGEVYEGKEIGTVTIFQNDLRISTNVKNDNGTPAITTLVSEEVNDAVLRDGGRWLGDAFVVNAWYITAYEPIRDINDNIIGILYVGILKKPFDDIYRNSVLTFLGIGIGVVILIVFVAIMMTKKISAPLRKLEEVAKRITDGDYNSDFSIKAPREIESLASSLNKMANELEIEKKEIEDWANTLEEKVEKRSEQLKKIHGQLFRSEKLASIGKLAAGVAHEINNPLTGVLTNASLLLDDLEEGDERREDVEVIVNETIRCREIVKRLLDFARQTRPKKAITSINTLIENIIMLVRNQTSFRNITIEKNLDKDVPEIMADTDQIQQVFINLILNASDAMSEGGKLTIESKVGKNGDFVVLEFADNGCGISEEDKRRIFDPFFTTKGSGTGLGLSISYGIIERHGGTINVESTVGVGTIFTIHLP